MKGNESKHSSLVMVQDLITIQNKLMSYPTNDALWRQETAIQYRIQQQAIVRKFTRPKGPYQNWIYLRDKNMKFFQTESTIRKRQNFILKLWMKMNLVGTKL